MRSLAMVSGSPRRMKRDAPTCAAVSVINAIQNWLRLDKRGHPGFILERGVRAGDLVDVTLVTIVWLAVVLVVEFFLGLAPPGPPLAACVGPYE